MPKISYLEHLPYCFFSLSHRQPRPFFSILLCLEESKWFQGVIPCPDCSASQCPSSGSTREEGCEAFLQFWLISHWARQSTFWACSWGLVWMVRSSTNTDCNLVHKQHRMHESLMEPMHSGMLLMWSIKTEISLFCLAWLYHQQAFLSNYICLRV